MHSRFLTADEIETISACLATMMRSTQGPELRETVARLVLLVEYKREAIKGNLMLYDLECVFNCLQQFISDPIAEIDWQGLEAHVHGAIQGLAAYLVLAR